MRLHLWASRSGRWHRREGRTCYRGMSCCFSVRGSFEQDRPGEEAKKKKKNSRCQKCGFYLKQCDILQVVHINLVPLLCGIEQNPTSSLSRGPLWVVHKWSNGPSPTAYYFWSKALIRFLKEALFSHCCLWQVQHCIYFCSYISLLTAEMYCSITCVWWGARPQRTPSRVESCYFVLGGSITCIAQLMK